MKNNINYNTNMICNSGCNDGHINRLSNECIEHMPVGMAYVPWQHWTEIYDIEKGFRAGTIFPELNKPYMGRRCYK